MKFKSNKFLANWPMVFTVGVVAYFALTIIAMIIGDHVDNSASNSGVSEAKELRGVNLYPPGAVQFDVESFTIDRRETTLNHVVVNATIKLTNDSGRTMELSPRQITLRGDGTPLLTSKSGPESVFISKDIPIILALTFELKTPLATTYDLMYDNRVVYTGSPV